MNIKRHKSFLSKFDNTPKMEVLSSRSIKHMRISIADTEEQSRWNTSLESMKFPLSAKLRSQSRDAFEDALLGPDGYDFDKDRKLADPEMDGHDQVFNKTLEAFPKIKNFFEKGNAIFDELIAVANQQAALTATADATNPRRRNQNPSNVIKTDDSVKEDIVERSKELNQYDPAKIKDFFINSKENFNKLTIPILQFAADVPWRTNSAFNGMQSKKNGSEIYNAIFDYGGMANICVFIDKFLSKFYMSESRSPEERKLHTNIFIPDAIKRPDVIKYKATLEIGKLFFGNKFNIDQIKLVGKMPKITAEEVVKIFDLDNGFDSLLKSGYDAVNATLDPNGTGKPKVFGIKFGASSIFENRDGDIKIYDAISKQTHDVGNVLDLAEDQIVNVKTFLDYLKENISDKTIIEGFEPYLEDPKYDKLYDCFRQSIVRHVILLFKSFLEKNEKTLKSKSRNETLSFVGNMFLAYPTFVADFQKITIALGFFDKKKTALESTDTKIKDVDDGTDIDTENINGKEYISIENRGKNFKKIFSIKNLFYDGTIDSIDVKSKVLENPDYLKDVYKNILKYLIGEEIKGDTSKLNSSSYKWSRYFEDISQELGGKSAASSYYKNLIKAKLLRKLSNLEPVGANANDREDPLAEFHIRFILDNEIALQVRIDRVGMNGFKISKVGVTNRNSLSDENKKLADKIVSVLKDRPGFYSDSAAVEAASDPESDNDWPEIKKTFTDYYTHFIDDIIKKVQNKNSAEIVEDKKKNTENIYDNDTLTEEDEPLLKKEEVDKLKKRAIELIEKRSIEGDLTPEEKKQLKEINHKLSQYESVTYDSKKGSFEDYKNKMKEPLTMAKDVSMSKTRAEFLFKHLLSLNDELLRSSLSLKERKIMEEEKKKIIKEMGRSANISDINFSKLTEGIEKISLEAVRDAHMFVVSGGDPNDTMKRALFYLRKPEYRDRVRTNLRTFGHIFRALVRAAEQGDKNIKLFLDMVYPPKKEAEAEGQEGQEDQV